MATQIQTTPNDANPRPLGEASDPTPLGSATPASMRCPDPSAHDKTNKSTLQDQASAAALYSTNPGRKDNLRDPLGPDGKLSSASAATSLKKAQAHELPSFPVVGIDTQSSAGTAATLAHANRKSPEWWKPEQSAAAGKAALLANEYKMAPQWQPEISAAGSKAALLAHKDGVKLTHWTPEANPHGNSAANIAMSRKASTPQAVDNGDAEDRRKKALLAATGAVSTVGRRRAQSTPTAPPLFPDSENSARNALSAATLAHTPSMRAKTATAPSVVTDSNRLGSGAMEAARIQHSKSISREMYTSAPPVALEVEEKKRKDALRASAISMAKKMYDIQQQNDEVARTAAQTGAITAHSQHNVEEEDIKTQAMRFIGVQEAAQKLAAERLAKIGYDENAMMRSHYGFDKPTRSRLSIRRGRNRASSNPEPPDSSDDEFQSRRIRSQMSQLNKTLAEVDAKKREQDRKHLLAAAERKVQAQMLGLDKKIFDETGKMSPAMIEEWDAKARAKAAANSEVRMENHGRVHIGNGKYMDQKDIDAVALSRVQPTLDEITEKTEKRRAEEEERRLELEEKKRQERIEKERAADIKAEEKRAKDEERKAARARTAEEKAAAKQEKEAEREKREEEKRLAKEEKRKAAADGVTSPTADAPPTDERESTSLEHVHPMPEADGSTPNSPTSPTSPASKGIRSFLSKFKRRSRHSSTTADAEKPGFIGGAALRASSAHSHKDSTAVSPGPEARQSAGRRFSDVSSISSAHVSVDGRGRSPKRTVSGLSAASGTTEFEEARDGFDEKLAPPPNFTSSDASAGRKGSPNRDSRFHEVGI